MILEQDANGDGKIQRSEAPEQMTRFFDRADANGDDVIDKAELEALASRAGGGSDSGNQG